MKTGSGAPAQRRTLTSTRLREIAEQVAEARRARVAREPEARGDVPSGDVDVRAGAGYRLGDAGSALAPSIRTSSSPPGSRRAGRRPPTAFRRGAAQLVEPPGAAQAPVVAGADRCLEPLAYLGVQAGEEGFGHARSLRRVAGGSQARGGFPARSAVTSATRPPRCWCARNRDLPPSVMCRRAVGRWRHTESHTCAGFRAGGLDRELAQGFSDGYSGNH